MSADICIGCGLETEQTKGETHPYMLSSTGCWSLYGEVLVREYSNPDFMRVHALTVDAYALQHPGIECPQSISSVYIHLLSLYAYFEKGVHISSLAKVKRSVANFSKQATWLTPPLANYKLVVKNILECKDVDEHSAIVTEWAREVFEHWASHHELAAGLYKKCLVG